ncbi:MAG: hypothetical protein J0I20_25405 [Chloroflexi bacterium]|nr:hypothetical protein [Chloroflexota bacterium]OJW01882.1 MAG: hypothetical protein BGO39_28455 [Chloroflexi bacterium 54-19]
MSTDKEYGEIFQIIPAGPGWEAIYCSPFKDGPFYIAQPVVCWAVVESHPTAVIGMVAHHHETGELIFASDSDNFLGYNYPNCTENWEQEALNFQERIKARESNHVKVAEVESDI